MGIYGFLLIGFLIALGIYYYTRSAIAGILVGLVFVSVVHFFTERAEEHHHSHLAAKYGEDYDKYGDVEN